MDTLNENTNTERIKEDVIKRIYQTYQRIPERPKVYERNKTIH